MVVSSWLHQKFSPSSIYSAIFFSWHWKSPGRKRMKDFWKTEGLRGGCLLKGCRNHFCFCELCCCALLRMIAFCMSMTRLSITGILGNTSQSSKTSFFIFCEDIFSSSVDMPCIGIWVSSIIPATFGNLAILINPALVFIHSCLPLGNWMLCRRSDSALTTLWTIKQPEAFEIPWMSVVADK